MFVKYFGQNFGLKNIFMSKHLLFGLIAWAGKKVFQKWGK